MVTRKTVMTMPKEVPRSVMTVTPHPLCVMVKRDLFIVYPEILYLLRARKSVGTFLGVLIIVIAPHNVNMAVKLIKV